MSRRESSRLASSEIANDQLDHCIVEGGEKGKGDLARLYGSPTAETTTERVTLHSSPRNFLRGEKALPMARKLQKREAIAPILPCSEAVRPSALGLSFAS